MSQVPRPLVVRPGGLRWSLEADVLTLRFRLPRGSYVTGQRPRPRTGKRRENVCRTPHGASTRSNILTSDQILHRAFESTRRNIHF